MMPRHNNRRAVWAGTAAVVLLVGADRASSEPSLRQDATRNSPSRTTSAPPIDGPVDGELLVKVQKAGAVAEAEANDVSRILAARHKSVGGTVLQRWSYIGWELVKLPRGMSLERGHAAYTRALTTLRQQRRGVVSPNSPSFSEDLEVITEPDIRILIPRDQHGPAEPIVAVRAELAGKEPNDPQYPQQGRYKLLQAPAAWAVVTGTKDIVVAVVDGAVDYSHEDIRANMWTAADGGHGYNTCNGTSNPGPADTHGTHVGGIIGAVGNNTIGVVGVNWTTKILSINFACGATRVEEAGGTLTTLRQQLTAYQFIVDARHKGVNIGVANNSWRNVPLWANSAAQKAAIDAAGAVGVVSVFAAGNDTNDNDSDRPTYPASYKSASIISVAATGPDDSLASWSSWGLHSVHLTAPGVGLLSTYPMGEGKYGTMSGTSMAAPVVSGAVALLLAANPQIGGSDISEARQKLIATVDKIPGLQSKVVSGGRLNLNKLIQSAGSGGGGGGSTSEAAGTVAFVSTRDGHRQIYKRAADGKETRLTNDGSSDYDPTWTPAGQIVFTSDRSGHAELYVMNSDGTSQTRLTNSGGDNSQAAVFSPK